VLNFIAGRSGIEVRYIRIIYFSMSLCMIGMFLISKVNLIF